MDIRRYFGAANTKQSGCAKLSTQKRKQNLSDDASKKKKRAIRIIESDSDDEEPLPGRKKTVPKPAAENGRVKLPEKTTIPPKSSEATAIAIGEFFSKSQEKSIQNYPCKLAETNVQETTDKKICVKTEVIATRSSPRKVNQKNVQTTVKKNNYGSKSDFIEDFDDDDDDFKETLRQLDRMEQKNLEKSSTQPETKPIIAPKNSVQKSEIKGRITSSLNVHSPSKSRTINSPVKTPTSIKKEKTTEPIRVQKSENTEKKTSLSAKLKTNEEETKFTEIKKNSYYNYRNYLNRSGPKAPGSKPIPEGEPGCLSGLTIVITGVMDCLEREEAAELAKKYGAKVTQSVSKNTDYVLVGEEAGPSKLEKATKLKIKQINEDEFLEMIASRKGNCSTKGNTTPVSHSKEIIKKQRKSSSTADPVLAKYISSEEACKGRKISKKLFLESSQNQGTGSLEMKMNDNKNLLWVEKHKPTSRKQIIGQQGDQSNANKLFNWLTNWHKNNNGDNQKKAKAGSNNPKTGTGFKAALLSGPPGVGKTTTATVVCQELGIKYIELNASDTRSKRSLHEVVSEFLRNHVFGSIGINDVKNKLSHCLIMDEVDGMAGNEDRGGIPELIQLIKTSKVPIICICNDRRHRKIQSLSNYCFDLQFHRPRLEQIKGAMSSLCFKENFKIAPAALEQMILASQQDIRQVVHHLSLWAANRSNEVCKEGYKSQKNIKLNPFETVNRVFNEAEHAKMSLHDKTELFFHDYSIAPLMVQENYIHMKPSKLWGNNKAMLRQLSKAADSLCDGDLIDNRIRRTNSWSLLPVQAVFASLIPGELLKCKPPQISFSCWLGKNSRANKFARNIQDISAHMRLQITGNKTNFNLDYSQVLCDSIIKCLRQQETSGVAQAVAVIKSYDLLKDDWDNLVELSTWPNTSDPMNGISPKVKAAFTRMYNSNGHLIPYAINTNIKKLKSSNKLNSFGIVEDFESEENEEEISDEDVDEVEGDAMIKVKNKHSRSSISNRGVKRSNTKRDGGGPAKQAKKSSKK